MDRRAPAAAQLGLVTTSYCPPAVTHYVTVFHVGNGYEHDTACGLIVEVSKHSDEPTCPQCAWWMKEHSR